MRLPRRGTLLASGLLPFLASACSPGDPIATAPAAAAGTGPRITWDLGHQPLPEIPMPNDVATSRDDDSPTGLRLNASMVAPTHLESLFRQEFDELDGWGTYEPITIPFTDDLDLGNVLARHHGDDFAFPNDAVYLVDLDTGLPMPLDLGEGNYPFTRRDQSPLFANDYRAGQSNLIFETVDEDTNHDGILQLTEDTNFDGILGRPNVYPSTGTPYDNLTGFYENSSHTLIARPLLPLLENHHYAVVVTDRLVGTDGQPVRSPFDTIAHPTQVQDLAVLDGQLRAHPEVYGTLRYARATNDPATASHVAFAWKYTTQTTASEWFAVRAGLYGRGTLASLAQVTPRLLPQQIDISSSACTADEHAHPYVINPAQFTALMALINQFNSPLPDVANQAQAAAYDHVAYMVVGSYHAPYLLASDPVTNVDPHAHWQVNARTGVAQHVGDAEIPFLLVVPKATPAHPQPFPLAFYTHGYGADLTEELTAAGILAQNGIATIAIDGPTHGFPLTPSLITIIQTTLRSSCVVGAGDLLTRVNRARDLDGNGVADPAGDFWTAYIVHSRDNVRQYALEISQLVRAVRGWDGTALAGVDLNADGNTSNDIAGDFDGDHVPDVGLASRLYIMGESLGGIMTQYLGGAEPLFRAAVPFSGGGGLSDVATRSSQGGISEAVYLRLMGPLLVTVPASQLGPSTGGTCSTSNDCDPGSTCGTDLVCHTTHTACTGSQLSLRIQATNVTSVGQLEVGCLDLAAVPTTGSTQSGVIQPGDDVVVINTTNGTARCARADANGLFRIGVPSDVNDSWVVEIFRGGAVTDYATCTLGPSPIERSQVETFQTIEGDCSEGCGHVPTGGLHAGTVVNGQPFQPTYTRITARGQALTTPIEGLGLRRQSPEFRRILMLSQGLLDKGDPISFAPYYFLRDVPHVAGFDASVDAPDHHAVIVTNTAGDQNVPLNTGNAFSRAAGILPFFTAATAPAHLRDYASPDALTALWSATPNHVLIDDHVLEGINWLDRWPVPLHPNALLDVDDLDEGLDGFGELVLAPRLRLVRLARPQTSASDLAAVWAPRMQPPWTATPHQYLAATLNYYVQLEGHHSVDNPPRPDLPWDYTTYMYNLVGQFFQSDGTDVYYATHPDTHRCLETNSCPQLMP